MTGALLRREEFAKCIQNRRRCLGVQFAETFDQKGFVNRANLIQRNLTRLALQDEFDTRGPATPHGRRNR